MRADFDLAVVGGGPAGASAALQAARLGLQVALFEPRTDDQDKPCGEGLLPAGVTALRALGLESLTRRARRFETLTYRAQRAPALALRLPDPGYAIRRPELQRALNAALAAAPMVTRFTSQAKTTQTAGGFLVEAPLVNRASRLSARTLVAADGLGGNAVGWLRRSGWASDRTGVRARYASRRELEGVEIHLGRGCEVYLTPLPEREVNVAFLFEHLPDGVRGADALVRWALARHPAAAETLGELTTAPSARRLDRRPPRRVAASGAFLAGDTGGGVDPVVGCGLTVALTTGRAAARAAAALVRGDARAPEADYARIHARETRLRRGLAWSLRRAARFPGLLRGLIRVGSRAPVLLHPLIRVAAGRADP